MRSLHPAAATREPSLRRITGDQPRALFDTLATRRIEQALAAQCPPHTLMQRAGLAVARLAQAIAPHARSAWVVCGAGNNGGDGLEAAFHLHRAGRAVTVTWLGRPDTVPPDALASYQRATMAGVVFSDSPPPGMGPDDVCVDALLGIGLSGGGKPRVADPRVQHLLARLHAAPAPVLCVDTPSGLSADTGQFAPGLTPPAGVAVSPRHTLALLTLKPGLFTGDGRDAAGQVWLDDLGAGSAKWAPCAWLAAAPPHAHRAHASHKGSYGDVAVVGGEGLQARGMGMTGAALLAASAALHAGAGRVMVALLDEGDLSIDALQPECMLRRFDALRLDHGAVVCGCGGGEAVRAVLPRVLAEAHRLVLDADALNAVAGDPSLAKALQERAAKGWHTVLTPHPLEAARLSGQETQDIQADRLGAASRLAQRFGCAVVLKGSGSVIAAPGQTPRINPTGNARLATGGTGDVLAGLLGARLAAAKSAPDAAFEAAISACWMHGQVADQWPPGKALTASALARQLSPG
ncbi:NAD(P)H-hydrate dehydratase [Acidovorax sp. NCPPB 3576]|uniref:NAD(P)H-hydrate dehydratase n=1 Tax=Acidovorax sp. NCPPB 3576 TaxID=2940488 RepID=UPI002349B613|nr:NAD(P)H-hydrate dehydratase [Acidovorax sp. NCPPB 3576]WCM89984.1 NAD(P)H-hydrate dehydratase [Acidovorax sp. NCPPB 3576]